MLKQDKIIAPKLFKYDQKLSSHQQRFEVIAINHIIVLLYMLYLTVTSKRSKMKGSMKAKNRKSRKLFKISSSSKKHHS